MRDRIFTILVAVIVLLILAFTASRIPAAHAQTTVRATTSPIPTPIPVNGQWLFLGGGNSIQGECVTGYEPSFFKSGQQWQVICLYGGE